MSSFPGGATVLRQSIGEDKYIEMVAVQGLAGGVFSGDIRKAKELYQQQSLSPKANRLSKDLMETSSKYAEKLGTQLSQYNTTMQVLNNISPKLAASEEGKIRKFYLGQNNTYTTLNDIKVKEDLSAANAPWNTNTSIGSTMADNVLNQINYREGGMTGIKYLPGGRGQVIGESGELGTVYNIEAMIAHNTKYTAIEADASGVPIGEIITSTAINIFDGFGTSMGRLFGRGFGSMYATGAESMKPYDDWAYEIATSYEREGEDK